MTSTSAHLAEWALQLRRLATPALSDTPLCRAHSREQAGHFIREFADEFGHRRPVDRPLLAWMMGESPGDRPNRLAPECELWWSLSEGLPLDASLIDSSGPLLGSHRTGVIETDTEAELSALHALWNYSTLRGVRSLQERCVLAARRLIDETQPDNATAHPWGVHVFVLIGIDRGWTEADSYAHTLVHNALVAREQVERFSACLLLDAAAALEKESRGRSAQAG